MTTKVGIIGVQGDVSEHETAVREAGEYLGIDVETVVIRSSGVVPDCDVLVLPGGESTTISSLVTEEGIADEILDHVDDRKPMLATCAGLIVSSRDPQDDRVESLGVIDAVVDRNAFGRQKESFEAEIDVKGLDKPFHAVFIRAPAVEEVGEGVEVLAEVNGSVVAVRDGSVVGTSFHPELTGDYRIHRMVLEDQDKTETEND
ncbi:MAG: pyridoxal 5'-phosphate synthase glutaminase subunit PdxT [Halobacteria archaeon]|nr:pyridoxal 5'-phosphate synthase glutaminase subunit PdxT [Halobacteria archaeon]